MKKRILSFLLAVMLVSSFAVPAFAEGEAEGDDTVELECDVIYVTVNGDGEGTVKYMDADTPDGAVEETGTKVTVEGSVDNSDGYGDLNGVFAYNGAEVIVSGDVKGYDVGAYADGDGTTIEVGGDSVGTDTGSTGAYAFEGGTIEVEGDAEGEDRGVYAGSGSTVTVEGDAEGSSAIVIEGSGNTVVVEGVASGDYSVVIVEDSTDDTNTIIVKELSGSFGVISDNESEEVTEATDEENISLLKKIINYIVGTDKLNGATLSGTETKTVNDTDYTVAQEDDVIVVSGNNIESVSAGSNSTVKDNGNGTFSITIGRGGDIDISVTLKPESGSSEGGSQFAPENPVIVAPAVNVQTVNLSVKFDKRYEYKRGSDLEIIADITLATAYIGDFLKNAVISVDGENDLSDFFSISIENGKLILKITEDFLKTLAAGNHSVKLTYKAFSYEFSLVC